MFEDGASPDGSSTVHGYHKGESGHVEATDDNSNLWSAGGSGNKLPSYDSGCHERASMFGATGASRKSNSAALFHASGNVGTGGNNSNFDTDDGPLESEGDAFDSEGNWCGASEVSTDDSGGCSNNETNLCGEGTICDKCEICLVCQSCMLVG